MNTVRLLLLLAAAGSLLSCGSVNFAGSEGEGNGSETIARGIISDSTGAPVMDAEVRLVPSSYNPVSHVPLPQEWQTRTNESGDYVIRKVVAGRYNIEANNSGDVRALMQNIVVLDTKKEVTLETETLEKTATIVVQTSPGQMQSGDYIYIPGTSVFTSIDSVAIETGKVFLRNVPAGRFPVLQHFKIKDFLESNLLTDTIAVQPGTSDTVPFSAWHFSKKLFFNTTSSGANVSRNVTGFPVLVRLSQGNFNFSEARPDGADIRFTKENGSQLPCEIERWDASQSSAEIWVRADTVYGNDNTHYITMYWGAPAATSVSNSAAVFDTAIGFAGVWHLGQPSLTMASDATAHHYDGTPSDTAPSPAPGMIGLAYDFDGASNSFLIKGTSNSALNFPQNGFYTVSAWVFADTLSYSASSDSSYQNDMTIVSKDNCQYALKTRTTNWEFFEYQDKAGWQGSFTPATKRAWKFIVGVREGTRQYLYVDGKCFVDSIRITLQSTEPRSTTADVAIGKMPGKQLPSNSNEGPGYYFNGKIDEVRISKIALDSNWIKLSFMNQKATDALVVAK